MAKTTSLPPIIDQIAQNIDVAFIANEDKLIGSKHDLDFANMVATALGDGQYLVNTLRQIAKELDDLRSKYASLTTEPDYDEHLRQQELAENHRLNATDESLQDCQFCHAGKVVNGVCDHCGIGLTMLTFVPVVRPVTNTAPIRVRLGYKQVALIERAIKVNLTWFDLHATERAIYRRLVERGIMSDLNTPADDWGIKLTELGRNMYSSLMESAARRD